MIDSMHLAQAAEFLKIHPETCARMAKEGKIPGAKIGRAWVFHPSLLEEYLKGACQVYVEKAARFKGNPSAVTVERLAARRAQAAAGRRTALLRKKA